MNETELPNSQSPTSSEHLRQGAEKRLHGELRSSSLAAAKLSPDEVAKIIYELRVHQIELQMQNEELIRTHGRLEDSQAKYFDLFDLAPVGYLTVDKQGIIAEANLTAAIALGLPRQALLQQPFTKFINPDDQDVHYLHFRKLIKSGAKQSYEVQLHDNTGKKTWVHVDAVEARKGGMYRLAFSDIQAQKTAQIALEEKHLELQQTLHELTAAQEALIKQERLAAIGNLAAGIAHDFNNILAIVSLQIEMGMREQDPDKLHERLLIAQEQVQHAAALVQQILDFSRSTILQKKWHDLNKLLKKQISLLQQFFPENIQLELQLSKEACIVHVDRNRFQQLILNLLLNSKDACPEGGEVVIKVERSDPPPDHPASSAAAGRPWVLLTISDNGVGIPRDILPRVFEPFVSTKEKLHSHGLGLSQVYGIVKQHEGEIALESQVGVGTAVKIWLPASDGAADPDQNLVQEPTSVPMGHGEKILIVEDNEQLAAVLLDVLSNLNYQAFVVNDGEEGLQIINDQSDIDLVVSDMVMPKMGGEALFWELKKQKPPIPMILISGYTISAKTVGQMLGGGLAGILQKPVDLKRLGETIAGALPKKKNR